MRKVTQTFKIKLRLLVTSTPRLVANKTSVQNNDYVMEKCALMESNLITTLRATHKLINPRPANAVSKGGGGGGGSFRVIEHCDLDLEDNNTYSVFTYVT